MYEVQENYEAQKEEYKKNEESFKKKEAELRSKDMEIQESMIRYSNFLTDNERKKKKAEEKIGQERKLIDEKKLEI